MNKSKLLKLIKSEREVEGKVEKHIIILEMKRLAKDLGIIKGEYYRNDKLELSGSLALPLDENSHDYKTSQWANMKIKQNKFYGFTLNSREKTLGEKLKEFFIRSIEEGKIQDFIPFSKTNEG